jgi:signal transduction histidine kinase/CheY-like chemotaxis protein
VEPRVIAAVCLGASVGLLTAGHAGWALAVVVSSVVVALYQRSAALSARTAELTARTTELQAQTDELLEQQRVAAHQTLALEEKHRQLERLSEAKSQFLAAISHELRTPLNAVLGFTELLLEGVGGPVSEGQAEYLTDIRHSGTHLLRLINDILDYSKLEAGRLQIEQTVVDLARPVREAVDMLEANARKKGIALTLSMEEGLTVRGDPLRLKQVVLNLVANAIKFTPRGGAVAVALASNEHGVEFSVRDTGIGIAPEHQAVIFEAFHQVEGEASRRFEGTGLGLALVKKLLEPMEGSIRVESEEGHGARFVVTLPRPASRVVIPGPKKSKGIEVVVAEDDDATRHLLLRVLQANGCDVRAASDGQRALEALLERLPAVLVLDLMMPELDGYSVLERLRALPGGANVRVLVFSASEPPDDERARLEQLGAQVVVKGTVATAELVATVAALAHSTARSAA